MYNMEITIGSYKMRMEIVLLIVLVFWIMFGHIMCSCCTVRLFEGMGTKGGRVRHATAPTEAFGTRTGVWAGGKKATTGPATAGESGKGKAAFTTLGEIGDIFSPKEGFTSGNNTAYEPEFGSAQSEAYTIDPANWGQPNLTYSKGTTPDAGVQSLWNRPKQPIPLPEGELDMFATTDFKPECCPNTYSSSEGCACMTMGQYNYLQSRGGNNVPYSEY